MILAAPGLPSELTLPLEGCVEFTDVLELAASLLGVFVSTGAGGSVLLVSVLDSRCVVVS